jgi:hypothetical protein
MRLAQNPRIPQEARIPRLANAQVSDVGGRPQTVQPTGAVGGESSGLTEETTLDQSPGEAAGPLAGRGDQPGPVPRLPGLEAAAPGLPGLRQLWRRERADHQAARPSWATVGQVWGLPHRLTGLSTEEAWLAA